MNVAFRSTVGLYFFVILLILHSAQYSEVYGLPTTTHAPSLTLKSPISSSLESRVMNSNLANRNVIAQSPKVTTTPVPNQIGNIVITGVISGVTTFLALFGAWSLLDWKRDRQTRPVLHIDQKENPYVLDTTIDLSIYDVCKPDLPADMRDISKFVLRYRVNRIKVRNNGNSAAEDCKGLIIQDGIEMKVCWYVPSERHKMTINAMSYEYLDLCAFLEGNSMLLAKSLKENVDKLRPMYTNLTNIAVILEDVPKLKYEFIDQYSNEKDNSQLIKKYFPFIIAPTENDWQRDPHLSRVLKPGAARVRITSKNASPIECNITILERPENDKIIRVEA